MQHSAGQDLPHTRTRPVHWLATAAALAAVVAGASFVRPSGATATTADEPGAWAAPRPAAAPDPRAVTYPVDCGPNRVDVVKSARGDLDGDGGAETVVAVRCHAEMGTPPSGVYVLSRPAVKGAQTRIAATLLAPGRDLSVQDLTVSDGVISATLLGYSAQSVPRCCPDERKSVKWQWKNGKFVQSELPVDSGGDTGSGDRSVAESV